jgi:CheY-like chemotaxis protein
MRARNWILIVDDDADVQEALAELLATEGYTVEVAANGAEAIEVLEREPMPCAVIVDLMMPGIVGQELLEYLRHHERLASVPVAILSASPQLAPEGYRVFTKPISVRGLLDFIEKRC